MSRKSATRWMDPEKLKAKAVEKGVITQEEAEAMSHGQALRLIFAPGFSTAEKVSDVSGRGVGMDVVRSNIEKLKGVIELESAVGKGSTVKIKIPLTLAILPTLHCKVGSERYGIPLASVKETVRMPCSEVQTIRGKSVVKLREEILPLAFLREVLDVESAPLPELCVVVLQVGAQRLGCVVDDTIGQEEVVIKPLDAIKHICPTPFFSGAAILGNGTITLIVDVSELMRLVHAGGGPQEDISIDNRQLTIDNSKDVFMALLVEDGGAEQYALPIKPIKKIENIPASEIEIVGGRKVVRNDGNVLPVVHLYDITNFPPSKPESDVYLVIMGEDAERTGLVVNGLRGIKPIDRREAEDCFSSGGIAFSMVLGGRVTLVIADGTVFQRSRDYLNSQRASSAMEAALVSQKRGRILVADDSAVARESIRKFLLESGFDVVLAVDGKDALQKLSGIDLVVTDLEMPEMNGYELTRAIKKEHPGLPIIMVTTRDGEEDRLEGLKAGVDDYQAKLDGLKLVHSVQRHIKR
ncbi:MAG: chemotaxis protein CheW [Nitrospinae bacterium]|nr:chemotaxis protein CheW [Nitrospinota bacterium]